MYDSSIAIKGNYGATSHQASRPQQSSSGLRSANISNRDQRIAALISEVESRSASSSEALTNLKNATSVSSLYQVVEASRDMAKSSDFRQQMNAVVESRKSDERTIPLLLLGIANGGQEANEAAWLLDQLWGKNSQQEKNVLLRILKGRSHPVGEDSSYEVRVVAAKRLSGFPGDKTVIDVLKNTIPEDDNCRVILAAANSLHTLEGKKSAEDLVMALQRTEVEDSRLDADRTKLATFLVQDFDRSILPSMIKFVQTDFYRRHIFDDEQRKIIEKLGELKDPQLIPILESLFMTGWTRSHSAAKALGQYGLEKADRILRREMSKLGTKYRETAETSTQVLAEKGDGLAFALCLLYASELASSTETKPFEKVVDSCKDNKKIRESLLALTLIKTDRSEYGLCDSSALNRLGAWGLDKVGAVYTSMDLFSLLLDECLLDSNIRIIAARALGKSFEGRKELVIKRRSERDPIVKSEMTRQIFRGVRGGWFLSLFLRPAMSERKLLEPEKCIAEAKECISRGKWPIPMEDKTDAEVAQKIEDLKGEAERRARSRRQITGLDDRS